MMKKILLYTTLLFVPAAATVAQDKLWTMEECMQYAVEHSSAVKKQTHASNTSQAEYISSIGSFFPSVNASVQTQWSYGRNINPKDNTYDNISTFRNYYYAEASIPVFNGGRLINEWRKAKVNHALGKNDIQKAKDDLALKVLEAYVNVVYYQGLVRFSTEKLDESNHTLYLTRRKEELGLMGKADVILIEAQVATDDYVHTFNSNQLNMALLTLKEHMNYPYGEELAVDTLIRELNYIPMNESIEDIYAYASGSNPTALQATHGLKAAKMDYLIQKGRLFPTISFFAGVNTNYFKDLNFEVTPETRPEEIPKSFSTQFENNRGEYFGFTLSIPLFNRLKTITEVKRARNTMRIAQEQQYEVFRQLETAIEKAVTDRDGYAKETIRMEKKKMSDEFSYQVTLRKFEEGLMSPIDLQTSANTLLESKANLLQRKLLYIIKCKEVDYYKGTPLVTGN
ncbi:MAG: TolC family protein [Tannerellaceae bacterium]|jgi:outer membrane protein|nr:TolC family protein [Tannerellaceae bacterium]